ncbi:Gfo/Idh/MocA family oxidoreductase [Haloarchaeobius sp. HRN-SO-5]|uniref:Gfo/Idh/MocA family oxidoreductase n=1 Tax=Haloarchaeobius sp. HRN-SO-5 TaxID=3446118 RepID=UPI003EBB99D8
MTDEVLAAGVIGVGNMGANHARVYADLPETRLVGVTDADAETAQSVARKHGVPALPQSALLERADVVSVAVPTPYHVETAKACIDAGVHVLVEKPFVHDVEAGRDLIRYARNEGVTLQVGHVERFNPAVQALQTFVDDLDVVAMSARRLGPPPSDGGRDSVMLDLMVHDFDVLTTLVDAEVQTMSAVGTLSDRHVSAQLRFDDGTVATLDASRATQQKVRELTVTAGECYVTLDYLAQSLELYRHSLSEVVADDGNVRHRTASVVERPIVENGEPLRNELRSFVEAVRTGTEPEVTGEDGIRAVELAQRVEQSLDRREVVEQ